MQVYLVKLGGVVSCRLCYHMISNLDYLVPDNDNIYLLTVLTFVKCEIIHFISGLIPIVSFMI